MSHLSEPKETFLGVSTETPKGRGVGFGQAQQLIQAIRRSKAYQSGLLSDLSEMSLYVEGIDRDKISDLTTNVIRDLLVDYTGQQCELHGIETGRYNGPPTWDNNHRNWKAGYVQLPYVSKVPVLLVPKSIVRRKLSVDSQEFYNKQITDFLVSEHLRSMSSLVQVVKGVARVYKRDVREQHPKSKAMISDFVSKNPAVLKMYKEIAKLRFPLSSFYDDDPSITTVCSTLADEYVGIPSGRTAADKFHVLVMHSLTTLFYPSLIQPHKEWEINDGRKRIDIVYTNSARDGFFSIRRNEARVNANILIVECKNYAEDPKNPEFDQLLGRFSDARGKLGFLICRSVEDEAAVMRRCRDAVRGGLGYVMVLTDLDLRTMLRNKAELREEENDELLQMKFRELLA